MRGNNILFTMEKMERGGRVFEDVCESRSLEVYGAKLCRPSTDEKRAKALEDILRDLKKEVSSHKKLEAAYYARHEKGEFRRGEDEKTNLDIKKKQDQAWSRVQKARERVLNEVRDACESRGLIAPEEFAEFRYREIDSNRPSQYNHPFEMGYCSPPTSERGSEYPSLDQIRAFVVHKKAFIESKANIISAFGKLEKKTDATKEVEMVYINPPEDFFLSTALVERADWRRAHDFTPPVLMRSALYNTAIYGDLCEGLLQAARYGVLQEVLPGGMDMWAQQERFRSASYPTAGYIDLMMALAHRYFSHRNILLSPNALETYFSRRSPHQPRGRDQAMNDLRISLGLEEGATLPINHSHQVTRVAVIPSLNNPFAKLVQIWEAGLAPVSLYKGHMGIAYTPLEHYPKPSDISEDQVMVADAMREVRAAVQGAAPAAQGRDASLEQMIRRLTHVVDDAEE
jgi:hypothetical protein